LDRPALRLALGLALASVASGCASTSARWLRGATYATDAELPPRKGPDEVAVYYKQSFGVFEATAERRPCACHSVTLLRRMGLVPGAPATAPPPGSVATLAELTTDEYPRDEERSRLKGREFGRVLGIGNDELDLFEVFPDPRSTERGVQRLRAMAAALGADELRDVFYTGYAEHQMWEGSALSLEPTSTSSPFYVSGKLLDFKLRDVRFHGTAVRRLP
jgi:hypothetical protein